MKTKNIKIKDNSKQLTKNYSNSAMAKILAGMSQVITSSYSSLGRFTIKKLYEQQLFSVVMNIEPLRLSIELNLY